MPVGRGALLTKSLSRCLRQSLNLIVEAFVAGQEQAIGRNFQS